MARMDRTWIPKDLLRRIEAWRRRQPVEISFVEALQRLLDHGLAVGSAPSSDSIAAIDPQSAIMPPSSDAKLPIPSPPYRWQDKKLAEGQPKQVNFECPLPLFAKFQFCLNEVKFTDPDMKQGRFLTQIVEAHANRRLKALGIPIDPN